MCRDVYKPEEIRDAFYRGALALQDVLELPYNIEEEEFWLNEIVQNQFEIFIDDLGGEE